MRDIDFGIALKYDDGVQSSVAVDGSGRIVEVHRSEALGTLWYHTGQARGMDVSWSGSRRYDDGVTPAVALNDHGVVVEVHKAEVWDKLWYHVGRLQGGGIDWSASHQYDSGVRPSVALDGANWCVEVHESQSNSGLWYHVGQVDPDSGKIAWGASHKYDSGRAPRVAMNDRGVIVEVHKSQSQDTLWYHVGVLDRARKTISWGPSHRYDEGVQPSVALTDDGFVVEVHRSQAWGTLWRRVGSVDVGGKVIRWSSSAQFDTGGEPSVAVASDGSLALQTHQSSPGMTLWFSTSLVVDRMRWMEQQYDVLRGRPLWQVSLPGSHDSGAYDMGTDRAPCRDAPDWLPAQVVRPFAITQSLNMAGQLERGVRYFDLRPYQKDGGFHAYHDVLGASFDDMLDDVSRFLRGTSRELVILKISHFCQFDDGQHRRLVDLVTQKLGGHLYRSASADLLSTTIQEFVGQGSRAVVWYDDPYISSHPTDGFWRRLSIYDDYSNTDDYATMAGDQLRKMKGRAPSATELFCLSWTLTFKDWKSPLQGLSLREIAEVANRQLGRFLAENAGGSQVNVLYVDFPEDARATDCAILLNRRVPAELAVPAQPVPAMP